MTPTAQNVGHAVAKAAHSEPIVREVWVSSDGNRVDVWVVTEPIMREQELHLYGLEDVIHDRVEDADVLLHIQHANLYDAKDFVFRVPAGAELMYRATSFGQLRHRYHRRTADLRRTVRNLRSRLFRRWS